MSATLTHTELPSDLGLSRDRGASEGWFLRETTCWGISFVITATVMTLLLWNYEASVHWFLLPTFLFGLLVGRDVAHWMVGSTDTFDPISLFAMLVYVRVFVACLVNLSADAWVPHVEYPDDWRPWVGAMSALSVVGYVLMRLAASGARLFSRQSPRRVYDFRGVRATSTFLLCVAISLVAQVLVLALMGGFSGIIAAHETRMETSGIGQLLMLSEPLPLLLVIAYVSYARRRPMPSMTTICLVLFVVFMLTMLIGGLRGSRSTVVLAMFASMATIHFSLRRIPKSLLLAGAVAAGAFIYFYGFYKHHGLTGIQQAFTSASAREDMTNTPGSEGPWYFRLVGGGTNTYSLYRVCRTNSDFDYALGETYVGGLSRLVPSFIWSNRPPGIAKTGTDLIHGAGTWPRKESMLAWDLIGEAMLNFGPVAAMLAPILTGLLLGLLRAASENLAQMDARRMLLATAFLCILAFSGSSSRTMPFQVLKHGLLVTTCIVVGSTKLKPFPSKAARRIQRSPGALPSLAS